MPRDVNGNYSLPTGNPVAPDTVIESVWANDTMNDIKNEISNSLSRDGYGGMRAPFRNADGTMLNPGATWGNEPTSGWYRKTTNEFWYSVGNEDIFGITKTGVIVAPGKTLVGVDIPPPFPAGTRMLFQQTTAPVGWVKETNPSANDACIRVVTGAVSGGGVDAFTTVFGASRFTALHAITYAQMAVHAHNVNLQTSGQSNDHYHASLSGLFAGTNPGGIVGYASFANDASPNTSGVSQDHYHFVNGNTTNEGGGQGHNHGLTMNLKFQDVIIATKT